MLADRASIMVGTDGSDGSDGAQAATFAAASLVASGGRLQISRRCVTPCASAASMSTRCRSTASTLHRCWSTTHVNAAVP